MTDQSNETILSELDQRLESLFGEDEGDREIVEESPLEGLKSLIMTVDWEISEESLNAIQREIQTLKKRFASDKAVALLLKMLHSLAGYIQKNKAHSDPASVQLFHTIAGNLFHIVETPHLTARERNILVKRDIDRFQALKEKLARRKAVPAGGPPEGEKEPRPPAPAAGAEKEEGIPFTEEALGGEEAGEAKPVPEEIVMEMEVPPETDSYELPPEDAREVEREALFSAGADMEGGAPASDDTAGSSEEVFDLDALFREEMARSEPETEERILSPEELGLAGEAEAAEGKAEVPPLEIQESASPARAEAPEPPVDERLETLLKAELQELRREFRWEEVLGLLQEIRSDLRSELAGVKRALEEMREVLDTLKQAVEALAAQPVVEVETDLESPGDLSPGESQEFVPSSPPAEEEASLESLFEESAPAREKEEARDTLSLEELFEKPPEEEKAEEEKADEEAGELEFQFESESGEEVPEQQTPPKPAFDSFVKIAVAGKTYAVPADYVVRVDKLSGKVRKRLAKTGRISLEDLRAPFGSIKKNLFPAWKQLPAKELAAMEFPLVTWEPPEAGGPSQEKGIVLLKSGEAGAAVLTDAPPQRIDSVEAEDLDVLPVEEILSRSDSLD